MDISPAREKEASPLQVKPENLTDQDGTSSSMSESTDSTLQDEPDDSSVPIWVRRALAAGRTPLPCSRPPIKTHGMHIADSGRTARESSYDSQETVLEQSPAPEEKQTTKGKVRPLTSNDNPKIKKSDARPKNQNARAFVTMEPIIRRKVQRKKWKPNEIETLIRMREDRMGWVVIAEAFSNRTAASVRQTFFKYRPQSCGMESDEK
ncbi:hypothetical protein THAR02_03619 [Trichoderma harzianum]|uniref:Myb-like domain-containing protein n=1 Tax=Trichoderma harzianum TaxID=5544 RepID=A0A0F9XW27_TRIHA|nr:hypothetical protein THAR02_03619 [Trichoderma harzianum]